MCESEQCTGCGACVSVCVHGCISMCTDEIGHFYAKIDMDQCVNCGACSRICPSVSIPATHKPSKAYAAISKDADEYKTSTSGGAAAIISRSILKHGGVVYGCTGEDGMNVRHIRVDKEEDLWKLKGSKYVQSCLDEIYAQVKQDLAADKTVLFIGTPCQIAGVKKLFGKFERLLTVDLICHGVPSQELLRAHLNSVGAQKADRIVFRTENTFCLIAKEREKELYRSKHLWDLYYIGFFKQLFYRHSCYTCPYASAERVSDLTIGDFWGVKEVKTIPNHHHGLSVILVNTAKGEDALSKCSDLFYMEEHPVEEAVAGNAQLQHPSHKHKNTEKFRRLYPKIGFKRAAKKCLLNNRVKYALLALYLKIKKK